MMKSVFYIIVVLFFVLSACSEQGFTEYEGSETYLYFEKNVEEDSTEMSFFFYLEDKVKIPVVMTVSGVPFEEDTDYSLAIDPKGTTAGAENYDIPEKFTFKAGTVTDTAYIYVINSADLKTETRTIKLKVVDNVNYKQGPTVNREARILIMDKASQPSWWEGDIKKYYLGNYSQLKYELFMKVTHVSDLSGMHLSEVRLFAIEFKEWLEENPTFDKDNNEQMQVPVVGF